MRNEATESNELKFGAFIVVLLKKDTIQNFTKRNMKYSLIDFIL